MAFNIKTTPDGFYLIKIPFELKDEFKIRVSSKDRGWDQDSKSWKVSRQGINAAIKFLEFHFGAVNLPDLAPAQAITATITKQFTVEYVGMAKNRGQGINTALGSVRGFWSIEFPESILRDWFESNKTNPLTSGQTHYQVLCVLESATDSDIKSAHRRLARQWHPDVCAEDNAADMFRQIQAAFEVLSKNRRRYDAGLYFERETQKRPDADLHMTRGFRGRSKYADMYRPPLRCGLIMVEDIQTLNKFTVSKIVSWDDIADGAGRVMVSSWNKNAGPRDEETGRPKGAIEIKWY